MDTKDRLYLDGLLALKGKKDDYEKLEQQKQALLNRMTTDRENNREVLKKGAGLTTVRDGGTKKKDRRQLTDMTSRDQLKEFDIDDQRDGFRLASKEDEEAHHDVARLIKKQVGEMMATVERVNPDTGQKEQHRLFTDEEIAAQVYDPLVRQGLISETMVPSLYSRTQQMLDSSVKAYEERLKRDKRSTAGNFFAENAGLITSGLGAMTTLVGGSLDSKVASDTVSQKGAQELQSSWDPKKGLESMQDALKTSSSTLEKANQGGKFFAESLSVLTDVAIPGVQGVIGLVSGGGEGSEDGESGAPGLTPQAAVQLAQVLFGSAAAQLAERFNTLGIGLEVSSGFGSCVKRGEVANLLAAGKVVPVADSLSESLRQALKRLGPDGETDVKTLLAAATAFGKTLKTELADGTVAKAFAEADAEALAPLLTRAGVTAAQAALTTELTGLFKDGKAQDAVKEKAAQMMAEEFADDGPHAEEEKVHAKKHGDHVADWVPSPKTGKWVCAVCEAEQGGDPAVFAGMLERRIAQLERDKALLEWSTKLVGMGIDLAANFIAPLAAVGSAVKMAKNILLAGLRTRDLVNFIEKRNGLLNAASAFSQPVKNFVTNSRIQMLHYAANAAFEAVKIIGAALQCGGITAPAGFATTTAATMAQALEAVLYEIDKRVRLEIAWSTYRTYLARIENRRLGLEAMRSNPTLAKYAIAWGALIKKDSLVIDFIGACGLTPETLKDPNAKLDVVVQYLESRLPDDNVVTGRAGSFDVGEVQVTPTSWMKVQTQAIKEAKLAPGGTGMIVASLKKWVKDQPELQRLGTEEPPQGAQQDEVNRVTDSRRSAQKKAVDLLVGLSNALARYEPKVSDGKPCRGMETAKEQFILRVKSQRELVDAWVQAA